MRYPPILRTLLPFGQNLPVFDDMFQAMTYENRILTFRWKWKMRPVVSREIEFDPYSMVDHR